MTNTKSYKSTILVILAILSFSTFAPALAYAAPLGNSAENWQNVNGNSWAQNYSPQTQINKNNVDNLEVKWIFPVGSKALAPAALQGVTLGEGTSTPPIVQDGVVYIMTNYKRLYAIDATSGKQLWSHDYTINITQARDTLPVVIASISHFHGIRYWEGGDAILDFGAACDFYAVDAKTGVETLNVQDLCKDVPGNLYKYGSNYNLPSMNQIGTYEKGHEFIYVLPGSMHSTLVGQDSRHVTMGISMDPPYNILWRVFSFPRQDVPTQDWALQECDIGYFQTYPCSDVAAQNRAGLEWDWAEPGQPPSMWGGVTANWGQMVVDEDTGIVYTQTGNQGPYSNVSMTPGPRLYGSTIMAIDINEGKRVWWLQPFPHDPYDYDCNWSGILADIPGMGKVYMKGCKEGILYAMDAATGQPLWTVDNVDEQVDWGQIGPAALKSIAEGGVKYYRPDPFSEYDLREWGWISYPATKPGDPGKYCTIPCAVYPYFFNGLFGTDMSYDPQTATLFHYAIGQEFTLLQENPYIPGGSLFVTQGYPVTNTTIVARDASTGQSKWTYFYEAGQQRSHMIVTPGLLITGFTDGYLRAFDTDTGSVLFEKNLGASITVGPTIGADSEGNEKIFVDVGTRLSNTPGSVVAIGLSDRAAAEVRTTTVTTTARTTLTSTTTSVSTSATTRTVTTTTATTITSTMAPQTTTMTTTAPAMTVTSTEEVSTGMSAEVTYAAVAIAVIAIIGAAVLAMRKR
jgi:outer membrane protein assembly factor BamB